LLACAAEILAQHPKSCAATTADFTARDEFKAN
jgi:hypothetical protein